MTPTPLLQRSTSYIPQDIVLYQLAGDTTHSDGRAVDVLGFRGGSTASNVNAPTGEPARLVHRFFRCYSVEDAIWDELILIFLFPTHNNWPNVAYFLLILVSRIDF